jgi:glutathione S-transferase
MVLNYKGIPYTQSYISYPDIQLILKDRSVPPLTTGKMPYTLPAIIHPQSVKSNPTGTMNDSWPLALHLEETFPAPEYPSIFPNGRASHALAVAVQYIISSMIMRSRRIFIPKVPEILDERGAEYYRYTRTWASVYGMPLDQLLAKGEDLEKEWNGMIADIEVVVKMLKGHQGKGEGSGPFFEGEKPGYADFLVISFLAWCERTDRVDWERMMSVGDGELMKLWDACLPWLNGQGEEKSIDIPKA